MPGLNSKNVDLATCLAPCKPTEVCCGVSDTPLSEGKIENILRLHLRGYSVEEIARRTAPCDLPNPEAKEYAIDGSTTAEYRKRRVFERYAEHVRELLERVGE